MFGHEKGAFTGAVGRQAGKFGLANEGTIFLDEVGELSPSVQAKLLRVLQDKRLHVPVGGTPGRRPPDARDDRGNQRGPRRATVQEGRIPGGSVSTGCRWSPSMVPPLRESVRRTFIDLVKVLLNAHQPRDCTARSSGLAMDVMNAISTLYRLARKRA